MITDPIIAIVGRPNVGKSTLFNYLTQSRDALVADVPGLTRDRIYGEGEYESKRFIVIDTGGLTVDEIGMDSLIAKQTRAAIQEADIVLFMLDARSGLTPTDFKVTDQLRTLNKKITLVINKTEGLDPAIACAEFHQLGFKNIFGISASHGQGIQTLLKTLLQDQPDPDPTAIAPTPDQGIKVAIIGKPNAGKSTLVNRLLGEERVVVSDEPGTTRDSIFIPMTRDEKPYVLIDTAGVRRRARIEDVVEKFSVIKTLRAIHLTDVVIVLIDAKIGIVDQDLHLLGFVLEAGKSLIIAINKWDGLTPEEKKSIKEELHRRLTFVNFARTYFISALHGTEVGNLFSAIDEAYISASQEFSTHQLSKILEKAVDLHHPPLVKGRRVKLRYAHLGGHHPPLIIIHGTRASVLPDPYRRYLANYFRETLQLVGTPLRVALKESSQRGRGEE